MPEIHIRPKTDADSEWVNNLSREEWGSEVVIAHGETFAPAGLEGLVAWQGDERVGLATVHFSAEACELVTLNALQPGKGIGSALMQAVVELCRQRNCRSLRLTTTNDNTHALRFYQMMGFHLIALRPGAVNAARRVKPEVPLVGNDGIPIRDEIDLEMTL